MELYVNVGVAAFPFSCNILWRVILKRPKVDFRTRRMFSGPRASTRRELDTV